MHGNVRQWCQDLYGDYPAEQVIDPEGAETGTGRVLRGGSWFDGGRDCRSARRYHSSPGFRRSRVGFRLARGQQNSPVR